MNAPELTTRGRMMLVILLAIVCLIGLFDHSLWSTNDTREGVMIREMVRAHCWVTPLFNGAHYLEKPPLLHWSGALFCRLFGTVNEGLIRLPAAVYGFGSLLVILSWARALGREQAGFAAVFMCATSALFLEYARIVLTDAALTFMVVFSLWLFWRAYTAARRVTAQYLLFLLVAAFSFYAKGLIGPGMIWLAVLAWFLFQKRFKLALVLASAFAPVFVIVLAPWVFALWKTGGGVYLYKVFWENQFGRFLYFSDQNLPLDPYLVHKEPIYYYLIHLPLRLLPWTLLVVPALYYWFKRSSPLKEPLAFFFKTSLLAIVFLLHVSSAKAACYTLPLFPFIFLMTAIWLEDASRAWSSRVERGLIMVTFGLVTIAIIGAPVVYLLVFLFHLPAVWAPGTAAAVGCGLIALVALAAGFILERKVWLAFRAGRRRAALLAMPVIAAVIGPLGALVFMPAIDFSRTYVPFSGLLRDELNAGRQIAIGFDSERDLGAFMFYLDSRLETVVFTNRAALAGFLRDGKKPLGVIVPTKSLRSDLGQLEGLKFRVKRADYPGKKSDSFRLIAVDPDVKKQAEPRPKPGKPKRAGK